MNVTLCGPGGGFILPAGIVIPGFCSRLAGRERELDRLTSPHLRRLSILGDWLPLAFAVYVKLGTGDFGAWGVPAVLLAVDASLGLA